MCPLKFKSYSEFAWHRLPGEVVEFLSLHILKTQLDTVLDNLLYLILPKLAPSSLCYFVILCSGLQKAHQLKQRMLSKYNCIVLT